MILSQKLFLMIYHKGTFKEKWGLSYGESGCITFSPTADPKNPYKPLGTGTYKDYHTGFQTSAWTHVPLEVQVSFIDKDHKAEVLSEMGEIRMTLNSQFRPSTQVDELLKHLPEGQPLPGMDLPQIAYGGPPLDSHLYVAGGTSMNYVRNLLEYLVSKRLLKEIPQTFEAEFRRYQEIWMRCWGDTDAGKEVIRYIEKEYKIDLTHQ